MLCFCYAKTLSFFFASDPLVIISTTFPWFKHNNANCLTRNFSFRMSNQDEDGIGTLSAWQESEPEKNGQSKEVLENVDVEFEVERKLLKANKYCLSMISPVFTVMFKGEFKEKKETRIPLPTKAYGDMLEFIEVTHIGKSRLCLDAYSIVCYVDTKRLK